MFETPLFEWAGRSFGISSSTQLNSDLTTFNSMLNLPMLAYGNTWMNANGLYFAMWNSSTLDTPYTQGLTSAAAGFQLGCRISENNMVWFSVDVSGNIFKRNYARPNWSSWTKVA